MFTDTKQYRVIFFGTPEYVRPVLSSLINEEYTVVAVVTQPDRPRGRGNKLSPSPIKELALSYGISVLTPEKITPDFLAQVQSLKPDVAVLAAYGLIVPQSLLDITTFGFVNIHPSLLPLYRGATPMRGAILDGVAETGVTIMKMDAKMDHGPLLASTRYKLTGKETILDLYHALFPLASDLLLTTLPEYLIGTLKPQPQDHSKATFTPLLKKQDGLIDWGQDVVHIERKVRAYAGWPGACTFWNKSKVTITKASIFKEKTATTNPGLVSERAGCVLIDCGCGNLVVDRLQLAGKKEMAIKDFVHGNKDFIGSVLDSELSN